MGNYRFRLSDMIPNAWFYKLKDMSRGRKQCNSQRSFKKKSFSAKTSSQKSNISQPRYTYYFTTEPCRADKFYNSPVNTKASDTRFPDSPRRSSSNKRSKRKTIYKPSPKLVSSSFPSDCSCHAKVNSVWTKSIAQAHSPVEYSSPLPETSPEPGFHESLLSESEDDDDGFAPNYSFDQEFAACSSSCNCKVSSSTTDIIIDVNGESFKSKTKKIDGFETISEVELPPIFTKPAKFNGEMSQVTKFKRTSSKPEEIKANRSLSVKNVKEERDGTHKEQKSKPVTQRSSPNSVGIRLRVNSPRIASRKIQACARKSLSASRNRTLSESLAVVKSSVDPQKDFRDSMVEMIIENNIRTSKDLEDLLACYLSLNSKEYHDLIVKAFEEIWFDMTDLRL
ncbi:hypothetical protein P3X46_022046 [Hevea brasiliensis]|uniref:Transcription repressor n=1 Tax=Hevea brasiliensis TaxID=3981 RepID=A0ABQ9LLB1_HEVBR|nr:transcription repressor OFP4 [Hevea brasiliensis]KAJ9167391.1 hypothetical protein P3X46_022046 [Hevea brasiliensis]